MPYVNWDPVLALGVEELDAQHRELLDLLNRLHDGIGTPEAEGAAALEALAEYADRHFACEEGHMRRTGFPGIVVQRREHAAFVRRVADARLEATCCGAPMEATLAYLKHWLMEHIVGRDLAFRRFLEGR